MRFEDKAPKKEGYYWAVRKGSLRFFTQIEVVSKADILVCKEFFEPLDNYLWSSSSLSVELPKQKKSDINITIRCHNAIIQGEEVWTCLAETKFTLADPAKKCKDCGRDFKRLESRIEYLLEDWDTSDSWTAQEIYWEDKYDCDIMRFEAA